MSIRSKQVEKINYALYHDPTLIPTLFQDHSISRGLLHSHLRRAVPHRVGIEFECIGKLAQSISTANPRIKNFKDIEREYNVFHFRDDHEIQLILNQVTLLAGQVDRRLDQLEYRLNPTSNEDQVIESGSPDEFRISIKDYSQLKGLFLLLQEAKKYCELPIGGGIHIHIDFSDYYSDCNNKIAQAYITKHLDTVKGIFPEYKGKYNKPKVGIREKATYVNISNKESIEFRIAPLTFDYEQLIQWVVKCSKFVSEIISRCHLKKKVIQLQPEKKKNEPQIHVDSGWSSYQGTSNRYVVGTDYTLSNSSWSSQQAIRVENGQLYWDAGDGTLVSLGLSC